MKTITCRAMGGMCDTPITANSYEEWVEVGMKHIKEAHPEMAADIEKMPHDHPMMVQWATDSQKTWADTPDM